MRSHEERRRRERVTPHEAPPETMPPSSLRRKRKGAAEAAAAGRRISRLVYLSGAFLAAAAVSRVESQYTDGGEVSVDCDRCGCEGISGDGDVMVLENPSSGNRIAGIDGEYSEIAETSCGTSVFAVGSTIYELSGVDLESRTLEAVEMSASDECTVSTAPATADCYSGNTAMSLDGGVSMTLTICLCIYEESLSTFYRSKVSASVQGATDVSIPSDEIEMCLDSGFISQLVTATVGDDTYLYNFDLAVPGQDSSSDLSVASAPGTAAQSFICGELEEPTPAPVTPTPPTPEPTSPPPDPTPAPVTPIPPTPKPTSPPPDPTPAPVTPLPPPTPAPTVPPPEPTSAPVKPITPPTPEPTIPPTAVVLPPAPTAAPVPAPTPSPTAPPLTAEPTAAATVPETTQEPTASNATETPRALATASPTTPLTTVPPVLPPGSVATSAPSEGVDVTSAPTGDGPVSATLAPVFAGGVTAAPSPGADGNGTASPTGFGEPGTATTSSSAGATSQGEVATPAPSAAARAGASTSMPSTNNPISDASARNSDLFFEDKPLSIGGDGRGVDAEVVALALLALLTFFPVCVK